MNNLTSHCVGVESQDIAGSRRAFMKAIAAGAALAAGYPQLAGAQSLIEHAPASGYGAAPGYSPEAAPVERAQIAPEQMDWRRYLLQGERTILVRRKGELRRIRYCTTDGRMDRDGYQMACYMLRDVRADRMVAMDPGLLNVLCGMQRWMAHYGHEAVIGINSGFRTEHTNASTEGSVRNSMHLYGKAADIVIVGASSSVVGEMARQFNLSGGTGIYLSKDFVHVDTGPARTWVDGRKRAG